MGRDSILSSRRLILAAVVFGLFVVFDLVLFGYLIFDSLSQREIEEVLLETRERVEPLAAELEEKASEHKGDLYVVVTVAQEIRTHLESLVSDREIVRKVEIRDREGVVVYDPDLIQEGLQSLDFDDVPRALSRGGDEWPGAIEVPIGEFGTLVIGLSEEEVARRIGVLRRDLLRQTSLIGVLTVVLLSAALLAAFQLFRRARRSEEQALEAERLAYVGTLASGLAHEIRNPLNSLSLNMQMLEEEAHERGGSGSQLRLLTITRSELGRLERLATDFLSYAKPRPLELQEVPAVELLERVLGVLAGEIQERRAEVEIEDRSQSAWVRVDRHQMGQLLLNLAQNALVAATEGGRRARVRLIARREGEKVVLEVADNGPGIAPGERERVFDLFYSTRKGGTGLGLAIVRRIAQAHGAELEVDGAPGEGTVMRLRLPSAPPGGARREPEAAVGKRPALTGSSASRNLPRS